ncbi:MAG: LPS-assembly protein LptD [Planctomycetota bacterium]|jgi:hypothetical protein
MSKRRTKLFISVVFFLLAGRASFAIERQAARPFIGQDLHVRGGELMSVQKSPGEHVLVVQDGFSMSIGANQYFSDSAVLWLETVTTEFRGRVGVDYEARVYLAGNVSAKKGRGAKTTDLRETVIEEGRSRVVRFRVSGEVFVTVEKRSPGDPRQLELYKTAEAAIAPVGPRFVVQPEALVPELPTEIRPAEEVAEEVVEEAVVPEKEEAVAKPRKPGLLERIFARKARPPKPAEVVAKPAEVAEPEPEVKRPRFRYPVNVAGMGEVAPQIERTEGPDGTYIATVIGRFYLWQKQDERGGLLELQADNGVIFYLGQAAAVDEEDSGAEDILPTGPVRAIYLSGDVVLTEERRTIRADEMYYDFERKKAIAVNAVMRNFDVERGIPIYVRAAKLRQLAENKFSAEDITLTSSEFHLPQISLSASDVIITDTTTIDAQMGQLSDSSYDAQMHDVRMKVGEKTIFRWPFLRSNLQRPDVPLRSVHAGYDRTWGTSVESRWYLSRLLGLQEHKGTESTLELDYYSKRGFGSGVEIDYEREDYFGRLLGYIIRDTGEDKLGRHRSRKDLEPPRELRGRFLWRHKQFLPYNWQLATGVGYESDENFVESYYRGEFNVYRQETYVHLKRLEDNWALSLLGKGRINDFEDELEELPSAEFHLTGQSLFDDRFTLYSDTEVGRFRQRIGNEHSININERRFAFAGHRTELDMPVRARAFKIVPFVAGTFGYDDRSGFTRTLVDGSDSGEFGEDQAWIGEAGVRVGTQYWKVYPDVRSRLWDLRGLRHIIKPQFAAVFYEENDPAVEQRDTLNVGISQRLQTKRGPEGKRRTVDWMRLDVDFTWVDGSGDVASSGPDRLIWNSPMVPLRVLSAPEIFNGDLESSLRRFQMWGPRRDYFGADYVWRVSDTAAILSDMYFDMQSGVIQQLNFGFSRLVWPNLSYYIGSRYLRRVEIDVAGEEEKGSNAFTFAATYVLDPRYTLVFSQQFDFDYGENIRSDITLIRRYHRVYWSLTYSADESLDRQAVVFSIWPQGVPELALGPRRHTGLTGSAGY